MSTKDQVVALLEKLVDDIYHNEETAESYVDELVGKCAHDILALCPSQP